MSEQKYEIYYLGLKSGVSESKAVSALAQLLNIEYSAAIKIIRNTNSVLSSGLLEEKALQYLKAFSRAGLEVLKRECSIQLNGIPDSNPDTNTDPTEVQYHAFSQPANNSVSNVEFKGKGFEYFKIWIVNIFLTLITLGIYSAWAKVRNKQYFYGNTFVEGTSFRYTAKPIAILKGRLIALAFFALYSIISEFNPLIGGVLFLVLMLFLPWVIVRSLQFNARNSMFRNIRFNFDAKAKDAAIVFLLWPILVPLTFGLIMPFLWYKQNQFFVNHSTFGTTSFEFHAGAKDYYKIFLNIFLVIISFAIAFGIISTVFNDEQLLQLQGQFAVFFIPIMLLAYLLLFAYSVMALSNLFFNSSTIQSHGFISKLQLPQMAWLYFSNTIGIMLTFGLFIPWAQVRIAKYRAERLSLNISGTLGGFISEEQQQISALGEQVGEVFDMDVSIL